VKPNELVKASRVHGLDGVTDDAKSASDRTANSVDHETGR